MAFDRIDRFVRLGHLASASELEGRECTTAQRPVGGIARECSLVGTAGIPVAAAAGGTVGHTGPEAAHRRTLLISTSSSHTTHEAVGCVALRTASWLSGSWRSCARARLESVWVCTVSPTFLIRILLDQCVDLSLQPHASLVHVL